MHPTFEIGISYLSPKSKIKHNQIQTEQLPVADLLKCCPPILIAVGVFCGNERSRTSVALVLIRAQLDTSPELHLTSVGHFQTISLTFSH